MKKIEDIIVLAVIASLLVPLVAVTVMVLGSWAAGYAF